MEPTQLRLGDTWSWDASYPEYPATDGWMLAYALTDATGSIAITASANGADYSVLVAAADTAKYRPSLYQLAGRVSKAVEVHTVYSASCLVLPNLGSAYDWRSHARKVLEAIEAAIEGKATGGQADLVAAVIGQRQHQWKPENLILWRDKYKAEVIAEETSAKLAQGLGSHRLVVRL